MISKTDSTTLVYLIGNMLVKEYILSGVTSPGARRQGTRVLTCQPATEPDLHVAIGEVGMPEKEVMERAREAKREGKAAATQAGEFVHEEIEHVRQGKHGARSAKQAIAIGLSKARRAGVALPPPKSTSEKTRKQAERDSAKAGSKRPASRKRASATTNALRREGKQSASHEALSRQARSTARRRASS
jgi:hypothetical protein